MVSLLNSLSNKVGDLNKRQLSHKILGRWGDSKRIAFIEYLERYDVVLFEKVCDALETSNIIYKPSMFIPIKHKEFFSLYFKKVNWYIDKETNPPFFKHCGINLARKEDCLLCFFDFESFKHSLFPTKHIKIIYPILESYFREDKKYYDKLGGIHSIKLSGSFPLLIHYIVTDNNFNTIFKETISFYVEDIYKIEKSSYKINRKYYIVGGDNEYMLKTLDFKKIDNVFKDNMLVWFDSLFNMLDTSDKKTIFLWAHNISSFDGKFILRALSNYNKINKLDGIDYIENEGKIYTICIKKDGKELFFMCSFLLLISRLNNAAKSYNCEVSKAFFPYDLVSTENWDFLKVDNVDVVKKIMLKYDCDTRSFEKNKTKYSDSDFKNFEDFWVKRNSKNVIEYFKNYCVIDVEILRDVIDKFFHTYWGIFREISFKYFITIPRLTYSTFLNNKSGEDHNFNQKNIKIIKSHFQSGINHVDNIIRRYYFGGRCEVFKGWNTKGLVYYYDFPGIYSKIIQGKLPIGEPIVCSDLKKSGKRVYDIIKYLDDNNLVAFIKCETYQDVDCRYIPRLPTKDRIGKDIGKLEFCFGKNNGVYYSEELKIMLKNGGEINNIEDIIIFQSGNPLAVYAKINEEGKNKSKIAGLSANEKIYKLLNNSLYGKFGSKFIDSRQKLLSPDNFNKIIKTSEIKRCKDIDEDLYMLETINDLNSNSYFKIRIQNIAIASAISSIGRVILCTSILNIKKNNPDADLLYCDTDSMFWDSPKEIVCKNMYYNLDWETIKTYKKGVFASPKFYILTNDKGDDIFKMKGVNSKFTDKDYIEKCIIEFKSYVSLDNKQWVKRKSKILPFFTEVFKTLVFEQERKRYKLKNNEIDGWSGNYEDGNKWSGYTKPYINTIKEYRDIVTPDYPTVGYHEYKTTLTEDEQNLFINISISDSLCSEYNIKSFDCSFRVSNRGSFIICVEFTNLKDFDNKWGDDPVYPYEFLFTEIYWTILEIWANDPSILKVGLFFSYGDGVVSNIFTNDDVTWCVIKKFVDSHSVIKGWGPKKFSDLVHKIMNVFYEKYKINLSVNFIGPDCNMFIPGFSFHFKCFYKKI